MSWHVKKQYTAVPKFINVSDPSRLNEAVAHDIIIASNKNNCTKIWHSMKLASGPHTANCVLFLNSRVYGLV